MSYRYLFIIGTVLILFAHFSSWQQPYKRVISDSSFLSKRMTPIARSYFTGHKKGLKRKIIQTHRSLGLMHLMTPSGLHLSSLFLLLSPLIKKSGAKSLLSLLFYICLFSFPHLSSLRRMSLYSCLKTNTFIKLNSLHSFLITFTFSFLTGDYWQRPFSFCLSFLFLGAILFARHRKEAFLSFLMIHLLVNLIFEQVFSPLGFIYGLIVTLGSPVIFLGLIIDTLFKISIFSDLWLSFLNLLDSFSGPSIQSPFLLALPFFLFPKKPVIKRLLLLCSLVFAIEETTPVKKRGFINKAPLNYSKKIIQSNRITHYYESGLKCISRLYTDHWSTHCKK